MNRIEHLAAASKRPLAASRPHAASFGRFDRREFDAPLALLSPLHYERNYSYPLIIWLHGPGDDERQLRTVMPLVSVRNYVSAAPRGTAECAEPFHRDPMPSVGFTWKQTPDHIFLAEHRVFAALNASVQKYNIAKSRVFLAGFSTGGTMALRLALQHPTTFAGAASFCGSFPDNYAPLSRLTDVRRLKLLLATGRDSEDYPPETVCKHLRLFHSAGMSVCLRQYPCGDDLTTSMLADMDRWIMEQITVRPAAAENETASRSPHS